jgi:hypothetical protein
VPPPVLVETTVEIREISNVLRRAFVAGEFVHLAGRTPATCAAPKLHVDGRVLGPVETSSDGTFDVGVVTRDLSVGRHVAEVFCTNPVARLMRTSFWVAAPQSSSNIFFVVLVSLFMVYAIGWVGLRTLAGPSLAKNASAVRPGARA